METKCYVGTYGKYNEGSLYGKWMNLADYPTYSDFVAACKELHKNESDPEFMIQDWECRPDGFPGVEWIDEQDFNDLKEAMKDDDKSTTTIVDYSEKAFVVVGDTKTIKDDLKKLGGRFNGKLSCGAGWVFPKTKMDDVQKYLNTGDIVKNEPKTAKDEALWDEYKKRILKAEGGREDRLKDQLKDTSEIMMTDCGCILSFDKPHVDAGTFWFHDEGPGYEHYKQVTRDDKHKTEYFMHENLKKYDRLIKQMTERKNEYGYDLIPVFMEHEWCSSGLLGWGSTIYMMREYEVEENERDPRTRNCTHRMTEDDAKKALAILKSEREKFEKRLQSYLKRYGLTKIHFGTYWADR